MKKKVLSVILTLGMMIGMVGCGAKNPAAIIIEGNSYDLSADFQEVVGTMVEDGLQVVYMWDLALSSQGTSGGIIQARMFDEDGKYVEEQDLDTKEPYIRAAERRQIIDEELQEEKGYLVGKRYWISSELVDFECEIGVSSESENDDFENLKNFVESNTLLNLKDDGYSALYIDGKAVKLESYEERFEEWKEVAEEDGFTEAIEEYFGNCQYADLVSRLTSVDYIKSYGSYKEIKSHMSDVGIDVEEDIIYTLAMQEACEMLEAGEAERVTTVRFDVSDDDVVFLEYCEYYFDEDWDIDKFDN